MTLDSLEPLSLTLPAVLNTVLLVIGIPILIWLARSVTGLTDIIKEVKVVVLGTEDQGGLIRRVEGIGKNVHDLNNQMTTALMEIEILKSRIAERRAVPRP